MLPLPRLRVHVERCKCPSKIFFWPGHPLTGMFVHTVCPHLAGHSHLGCICLAGEQFHRFSLPPLLSLHIPRGNQLHTGGAAQQQHCRFVF